MAAYHHVQAAAWAPAAPDVSLTARYRALRFPETWQSAILDLCNLGRPTDAEPWRRAPTRRMELAVQALAPDLLALPRPPGATDDPGWWLCSPAETEPIPERAFQLLLNAWLRDLRPELARDREYRELRNAVQRKLGAAPPAWQDVGFELLRCPVTDGGTAAPQPHQYTLTTDWLARRVLDLPEFEFEGGRLRFHAMPRGPRDQGAELVSEPRPFEDAKGRTWWFSVLLNITLQTVPFNPMPRFHLHCGIRRWATRVNAKTGRLHVPYGRRATVLLRPSVPWLPGAPPSDRFAVARLERRRTDDGYVTDWADGGPTGVLDGISLQAPFPSAEEVLTFPEKWLAPEMRAGVVHNTAMGGHTIASGLMSNQRSEIVTWAEQALPPELRPVPRRRRTRLGRATPSNAPAAQQRARTVRTAAAFAVSAWGGGPVLEARLLWQTPEMRDTAIAALIEHLGLEDDGVRPSTEEFEHAEPGSAAVLEWSTPELAVRLRCLKLTDGLAEDLALPEKGRPSRATAAAAITARRKAVAAFAAADKPGDGPTLALVEIDPPTGFGSPAHDPKFALRLGLADAGVLSQFMLVPGKAGKQDKHRALMAWDDGLRQLGARVLPEPGPLGGLPDGLRYAAIWLVQKNRTARNRWAAHSPVAVLVTPGEPGTGVARVEGFDPAGDDGAGEWVPYPVMLLRLAARAEVEAAVDTDEPVPQPRATRRQSADEQRRSTEQWLQKVQRRLRGTPTLLFVHAQNARRHWTWIQDGRAERDRTRTGHAPARRLDPDLRLLRVRGAGNREVAQWWGVHPKGEANGIPAHLWVPDDCEPYGDRVFWSTTPKPGQFKSSAIRADKLAPRPLTLGDNEGKLTLDTDKVGWNPTLMELTVLGCHEDDGDSPEALALTAHILRQPPDYPEALALPLPLHLAALAQEYVLPIDDPDASDTE
ncbi:DUF3893 domain-containing protein [Actinomadura logoneensis]|uniref:DUF3893 domain-containing protein n=1 Tax=Actinomadura logoneensis TaxID=2293572 RepID=A0A372JHL6_9ACTN|nr:DUF3962 domain-containing protein [Actinomadura logoneensis]RFU39440.1 DUF3893 domain-containing protein [Actinomadura logoneensis]